MKLSTWLSFPLDASEQWFFNVIEILVFSFNIFIPPPPPSVRMQERLAWIVFVFVHKYLPTELINMFLLVALVMKYDIYDVPFDPPSAPG